MKARHRSLGRVGVVAVGLLLVAGVTPVRESHGEDPLDPARNLPLPCEAVSTPGLVPRSAKNIAHIANVCGFVGTDIEFQSRMASDGLHDYAFVGSMGSGLQIFDITDPARPMEAGGFKITPLCDPSQSDRPTWPSALGLRR